MAEEVVLNGRDECASDRACAMALCLIACLPEAEFHSPASAAYLHRALATLGTEWNRREPIGSPSPARPHVVAAYLSYLLPELSARSRPAADAVDRAIRTLRAQGAVRTPCGQGARPAYH